MDADVVYASWSITQVWVNHANCCLNDYHSRNVRHVQCVSELAQNMCLEICHSSIKLVTELYVVHSMHWH